MPKDYILITLTILVLLSCKSDNVENKLQANEKAKTTIKKGISIDSITGAYLSLDKTKYDFGKIKRQKTPYLAIDFEIENIGKKPLIILKTDVSCGCLSVDCSKKPILSGKKIKLTVNIDTKNQNGEFNKTIFIKSNADNDIELIRIVGRIK